MEKEEDLLDSLLAVAAEELERENDKLLSQEKKTEPSKCPNKDTASKANGELKEANIFQSQLKCFDNVNLNVLDKKKNSVVHSGDTDSSEDEGNRNYEDQKYNECGREIKRILGNSIENNLISSNHYGMPKQRLSGWKSNSSLNENNEKFVELNSKPKYEAKTFFGKLPDSKKELQDVYMDPIFGMRIVNPLISSTTLIERMQGRLAVHLSNINRQIILGNLKDKDWVICGVLISKTPPRTSQNGSQYSIWSLSDLKGDIKTISVFMFRSAHKDLWKTVVGTVIGVLNPNVMDKKEGSKGDVSLSVDNAQKVMVFGQSKDYGICKSIKKDGQRCSSIVNLSNCEFCVYHVKQEYQKCSKRSELQANYCGKGLVNLRNKVLGKNEVFYAGKSYTAIPAKKSKKLETKDNTILQNLMGGHGSTKTKRVSKKKKGTARQLEIDPAQRARDLELLKRLGGANGIDTKISFSGNISNEVTLEDSKANALNVITKLKARESDNKSTLNNVSGKQFSNKNHSDAISLEESKSIALSVISKLQMSKSETPKAVNSNNKDNNSENDQLLSVEDIENELHVDDLKYSDEEDHVVSGSNSIGTNNIDKTFSPHLSNTNSTKKDLSINLNSSYNLSQGNKCTKSEPDTPIITQKTPPTVNDLHLCKSRSSFNKESNSLLESKCTSPNSSKLLSQHLVSNSSKTLVSTKKSLDNMAMSIPMLSGYEKGDLIDLNKPVTYKHINRANMNAIKYIQRNGPIKKTDPNSTRSSCSKKRSIDHLLEGTTVETNALSENITKKSKLQESEFISDRFKRMMAMSSKHSDLLEQHDEEEKEKYFNKLEVKEKMEEKMVNTFKVKCKAVRCLKCKYTSFSASELCKKEGHPLKVFDSMKRFFKCSNCQNRTACLELYPTRPCNNCSSSKWEKTGMMKEKVAVLQHHLSIRGGEQKFVNSTVTDFNLDLLIPEES